MDVEDCVWDFECFSWILVCFFEGLGYPPGTGVRKEVKIGKNCSLFK
jgi:hypothetical protein